MPLKQGLDSEGLRIFGKSDLGKPERASRLAVSLGTTSFIFVTNKLLFLTLKGYMRVSRVFELF